jgi:hypothetical protein
MGGGKEAFAWTVVREGVNLTFYRVRREFDAFYLHLIGFSLSDTIEIFSLFGIALHGRPYPDVE